MEPKPQSVDKISSTIDQQRKEKIEVKHKEEKPKKLKKKTKKDEDYNPGKTVIISKPISIEEREKYKKTRRKEIIQKT